MVDVAVLVHGAGSTPDAAQRLLAPAVPDGAAAVCVEARGDVHDAVERIARAAEGHDVALVAGISLGAHAAALWAARDGRPVPLALVMPAWTGAPGAVAALTVAAAQDVRARGRGSVLRELRDGAGAQADWVLDELARAWTEYTDADLAVALLAAAGSPGPDRSDLATLEGPVAVVALADDPLHPEAVARDWARSIPRAALAVVGRRTPATDRGALGRAARRALDGLSGSR